VFIQIDKLAIDIHFRGRNPLQCRAVDVWLFSGREAHGYGHVDGFVKILYSICCFLVYYQPSILPPDNNVRRNLDAEVEGVQTAEGKLILKSIAVPSLASHRVVHA